MQAPQAEHHAHSLGAPHVRAAPGGQGGEHQRRLAWILLLTITFMVVEAAGGVMSGSLALLADAGHMLSDAAALLLSLLAAWLVGRATTVERTYGYRRAEFLAAFVNAMGLMALAVWIVVEAVERIGAPRAVLGGLMFWVASAGLVVNVVGFKLLHGHAHGNLNLKSALWHITGDLLGSLAAMTAAVVIYFTGWTTIDPLLSLLIAVLIGVGGGRILYDSANLLMDKVPEEIDSQEVNRFLADYPDVVRICDLHIWGVSSTDTMLTAHLVVREELDRDRFLQGLLQELQSRFGLAHMTVQLESHSHASCPPGW